MIYIRDRLVAVIFFQGVGIRGLVEHCAFESEFEALLSTTTAKTTIFSDIRDGGNLAPISINR